MERVETGEGFLIFRYAVLEPSVLEEERRTVAFMLSLAQEFAAKLFIVEPLGKQP